MAIDPRVLDLVRLFETLQEQGAPPSVEQLCSDCPDLREEVKRWLEERLSAQRPPENANPVDPATLPTGGGLSIASGQSIPGQAGRYTLAEEIARGGMGSVLHAHDDRLNRDLAVKVLHRELCAVPTVVRRFTNEAWIGGQLQHPGLVPVHDLGVLPDGRPFFAMKLVKGRTLASLLQARSHPGQDLSRFLGIFEQICQTIAYTHSRRVIHRDLKPANIMVGAFGEVQVMDWGIAKVLGQSNGQRPPSAAAETVTHVSTDRPDGLGLETRAGAVLGTFAYMAPEQARGQADRLDERCDVFGLGAILCEILTGEPPYMGSTGEQLRVMALTAQLGPALARLEACGADAELLALARRCLAAEPEDRPRDGAAVAAAMTAYLEGVRERLRQAELDRAAAQVKAAEERKRRRLTVVLASVVLLAMLTGGGAFVVGQRHKEARRQQTGRLVEQALAQATALRDQARVAPLDDAALRERAAALWRDTLAAADRAEQALGSGEADAETSRQASELLAQLRQEADDAERDRRMLRRLDAAHELEAELQETDYIRQRRVEEFVFGLAAAPAYAAAFREYGIDVESLSTREAAELIRPRRIRLQLAVALDDWYFLAPEAAGGRLLDISRAADPDPLRDRVRGGIARKDNQALKQLAGSEEAMDLPVSTLILLADVLHQQGMRDEGLQLLKRARTRHPNDAWVNDVLGLHLQSADPPDFGEAARCFAAAIALRPDSPVVWSNLGTLLTFLGRRDEAIPVLREAIRIKPDFLTSYERLGVALIENGQEDEALALFQEPLRRWPHSPMLGTIQAQVLQSQGKRKEAIAAFRKVLAQHPQWVYARIGLAILLSSSGSPSEARELLDEAERSHPELHLIHEARGTLLSNRGDLDGALAAYRKAAQLGPGFTSVWNSLAVVLAMKGRYEEALQMHRKALRMTPENATVHESFAETLYLMGRLNAAEDEYRLAAQLNPRSARIDNGLGLVLLARGQLPDAAQACRQAIARRPWEPWYHSTLGRVLRAQKDYSAAAEAFGEAIRLKPEESAFHDFLGHVYYDQDRYAESVPHYREAVRLKPDNPVLTEHLANALWNSKDRAGAIAALREGIEHNPRAVVLHIYLGNGLRAQGKEAEAEAAYRKAVALTQDSASPSLRLASLLLSKGRAAEAEVELRRADKLEPANANVPSLLSKALLQQGKIAEAVAAARKALQLDPSNPRILFRLGDALLAQGAFAESLAALTRANQLRKPEHDRSDPLPWKERLRECRRCLELDALLTAVRSGKLKVIDPAEQTVLAAFCRERKKQPRTASQLYADAFAASPRLAHDLVAGHRYSAARAAAAAARGEKEDAKERLRWRKQALDWLREDLVECGKRLRSGKPEERKLVQQRLQDWRRDVDLGSIRDKDAVEKLPADEREACRTLWTEVEALLKSAQEQGR